MRRQGYLAALVTVSILLAGCGGQPDSASTDSVPPLADGGVARSAGPEALIGSWTLTDVDDNDAGSILRLGPDDFTIFGGRCGVLGGSWRADQDGVFIAGVYIGDMVSSPECERASVQTPGWLRRVTAYRLDGPVPVLLDDRGRPVARLFPGAKPTAGPNMADSEAEPPVVTDEFRRRAAPAVELPAALTPVDRHQLAGRWVPASGNKNAYLEFTEDGEWHGSDGCNDESGRWLVAPGGTLLATAGAVTLAACDNVPVGHWLWTARRAGLDGDVLVLLDAQGTETGRLGRAG